MTVIKLVLGLPGKLKILLAGIAGQQLWAMAIPTIARVAYGASTLTTAPGTGRINARE